MDKGRFSLLLLEPSEIYFEDFSAICVRSDVTSKTYDFKKQDGRLKLCSKSLVFDPKDTSKPLIKMQLRDCQIIEKWKGKSKFIRSAHVLSIICKTYIEMLEGNEIAPYKFEENGRFLFLLNYANIEDCLQQILQLQRANTLPALEQSNMISAIVNARRVGVEFNPLWCDLYEKIIMETQADKISPLVKNPGRVILTNSKFYFQPYNNIETHPYLQINLSAIKRIVKRRFLLQHIGIEIYLHESDKFSYIYIALSNQNERDTLYDLMLAQEELKLQEQDMDVMTLQWQNGVVSNYDYLLYINSLGDRTINDLTQYPVFPWVLSDYQSTNIDLSNEKIYRDLSKPVGALNEARLKRLLERYNEMPEPKYIYGSHYSTPGFVLYYLARLYPQYMLCLQNGRFDLPDRMFNSCKDVFKNCLSNMADFKELVPQFYDVEERGSFLVNSKGINFGYRESGVKVNDVELPRWANSPSDFVETLRNALESDVVSKQLHLWIDLIFGYKQRGSEAVKAYNVFHYMCYEGNVDLDSIKDANQRHPIEVQIMEFGQVPKQIFHVPHPQRKVGQILLEVDQIQTDSNNCDFDSEWKNIINLEHQTTFSAHKAPVTSIYSSEDPDKLISVGHDSKLKIFSISQNKQIRSANIGSMPLSSCVQLPNLNTIIVGSWDNSIQIYDLDYGRIMQSVEAHEDAVTCMLWSNKLNLLCSGSSDCTIRIWRGFNEYGAIKPIQCLISQLDHNSEVTCFCFNGCNKHLAVGTQDGEVYIWQISDNLLFKRFSLHNSAIKSISYSPDEEKLVTCGLDKCFKVIDISTGMAVYSKILNSPLYSLKWDASTLFIGDESGFVYIWNIVEVKELLEMKLHNGAVNVVELSKNKEYLFSGGSDNLIKVWKPIYQ
nr:protein FAN-like [Onthophagus taurus]